MEWCAKKKKVSNMHYFEIIQNFMSRKDYDFDRSDASLFNFHTQLYVALAAQGIFFGRRENSYLRFMIPFFSMGITIVGLAFEALNIYMGVTTLDYSTACEAFCYTVMLGSIITIYCGFLLNKTEILNQVTEMEVDFQYIYSLGSRYRKPFMDGQLLIWKLFVGWSTFMAVTAIMFILYPSCLLLYQSLLATQDEYTIRPLIFPLWLPKDDPYRTPNFEIFLLIEIFYCIMFVVSFGGYVYTLFHFLLHYYILMDMIMLDFEVIFEGLDESVAKLPKKDPRRVSVQRVLNKRLGRIVTWHLSVHRALKTVSSVFRPPLVYQLMLSSVALCLIAYQIAEKLHNGTFDVLFIMLGIAAVLQLWIPCYLGTTLRNKGFAVGDACWNCGWHNTPLGTMICVDIVIILMRAQVPLFIKYTGQPVIQLETFSAIMSTAYSYFNMLRQSTK